MTPDELRAAVLCTLAAIAPEADLEHLDPALEFREQLDLDSMDFLNFAIGLHEALGVDVPESEYARLATLNGCLAYLGGKLGVARAGS